MWLVQKLEIILICQIWLKDQQEAEEGGEDLGGGAGAAEGLRGVFSLDSWMIIHQMMIQGF